jgi:sterol desaturase/sphingolipid hydroxylase (fatty acid hydroxylase superfamily)
MLWTIISFVATPLLLSGGLLSLAAVLHWWSPPKKYDPKTVRTSAIVSAINVFIVSFLEYITLGYEPYRLITYSFTFPPVIGALIYVVTTDLLFYINHYMLHTKFMFKHIHSWHHKVRYPTAFDFGDVHPFEMVLLYFCLYGIPAVLPISKLQVRIYGTMMAVAPIFEHGSGLDHKPLNLIWDPEYHNLHHLHFRHNYGVGLLGTAYDRLFGTLYKKVKPEPSLTLTEVPA